MKKDRNIDMDAVNKVFKDKSVGELLAEGFQEVADELKKDKQGVAKKFNCHRFVLDLEPTEYSPELVKETRTKMECSQAIFAKFLGVSLNTLRAWEQGTNRPRDVACRLMDEMRFEPEYWQKRLRSLVVKKHADLKANEYAL